MRVWLYQPVITLALLFTSAAGQRAAASPLPSKPSASAGSQRQARTSRECSQTLAATASHKPQRDHGPPLLACLSPAWRRLTAPTSRRPAPLQLQDRFAPGGLRLVQGPRPPPPLPSDLFSF